MVVSAHLAFLLVSARSGEGRRVTGSVDPSAQPANASPRPDSAYAAIEEAHRDLDRQLQQAAEIHLERHGAKVDGAPLDRPLGFIIATVTMSESGPEVTFLLPGVLFTLMSELGVGQLRPGRPCTA
jgi:hypothetical protein